MREHVAFRDAPVPAAARNRAGVELVFLDRGGEAQEFEDFFQRGFGLRGHRLVEGQALMVEVKINSAVPWFRSRTGYFFFFETGVNTETCGVAGPPGLPGPLVLVNFVCRMLNRFCTVQ